MKTSIEDPKIRFLAAFRGEMQANIIEFGKHLWEKDSDIFVFMARKAACFFDCLRELKIADVRGLAVSDRVLDMDLSFLAGRTITLVDDCVFSGTTLFHARDLVMKAGCSRCDTMTLSINEEWIRPSLLPGGDEANDLNFVTPLFKMDDSQCVQQCYDVVRAISIFPRPYDVDFPHTQTTKLSESDLDLLVHCSGWQTYDVSSKYQVMHGVRAFTLVPDMHILHGFMGEYAGLNGLIQAAKIRIYARQLSDTSWSVRMVPIVMLGAVQKTALTNAGQLWGEEFENALRELGAISAKARYRLMHYLVSWALLKQFTKVLNHHHKLKIEDRLRLDLAEMSFGSNFPAFSAKALKLFKSVSLPYPVEEPDPAAFSKFGNQVTTVETPQELLSACLKPFTWLYRNLELPARKLVYAKGLKASLEDEHKDLSRLRKGFSPRRLISRLYSSAFDVARYVSLFLDKAIDLGIAVPTVVEDGGLLFRAFRHGEDAVFGEAEERLSVIALRAYMDERGLSAIYGLELQKFVVLFIQIAVRDGSLLERLNTSESVNIGCRIVSIKGHLHGPVPMLISLDESGTVGAPFVEGLDYPAEWLIKDWENKGILTAEKTTTGKRYTIGRVPEIKIGIRKEAQSRKIGRCLGRVVGDKNSDEKRPLNNDTDLVLLSTCSEAEHQIRALSGELSILLNRWAPSMGQVRSKVREGAFSEASRLLLSANALFTAVNSGAMKYRWFVDERLPKVIREVSEFADKKDPTGDLRDEWSLLWPESTSPSKVSTPPSVWANIEAMGQWLITSNVAIRVFNYWLVLSAESNHQGTPKESIAVLEDCKKWCEYYSTYCAKLVKTPFGAMVAEILREEAPQDIEIIAEQCRLAAAFIEGAGRRAVRQLLSDSRLLCENYGTVGEFRPFPYAVFFDIENTDGSVNDPYAKHLHLTLELLDDEARLIENNHNPWRTGLWILLRGNRRSTKAAELCSKLVERCNSQGLRFRAVVVGQLSYDDSIRDMAGSVKLATGDFFRRVAELRANVLPERHNNSVVLVNEVTIGALSEGRKFCTASGGRMGKVRNIKSGNDELPEKKFLITEVHAFPKRPQARFALQGKRVAQSTLPQADLAAESLRGRIDIGIITIREDEFEAMLDRFPTRRHVKGTGSNYQYSEVLTKTNEELRIAVARSPEQGQGAAQALASSMITDLAPQWIFVVGIAGGFPAAEYTLGDVLLSQRMHDFAVSAATEGKPPEFQDMGGPMTLEVEKLVTGLKGMRSRLGDWNGEEFLGKRKPKVKAPRDILDSSLYGSDEWKAKVVDSLKANFPENGEIRNPDFFAAIIIAGNTLVKDTSLAAQWRQTARHASGVEMELGGVCRAARYGADGQTRVLAIRGLSDIVGYKRSHEWTGYACRAAAAFADALIRSGLIELHSSSGGMNL